MGRGRVEAEVHPPPCRGLRGGEAPRCVARGWPWPSPVWATPAAPGEGRCALTDTHRCTQTCVPQFPHPRRSPTRPRMSKDLRGVWGPLASVVFPPRAVPGVLGLPPPTGVT